jgi:mRNA interferase MazF
MAEPARGDIWLVYLDPTRGKEQAGTRPALIVSDDRLNQSQADLVIVVPVTSKQKGIGSHIALDPERDGTRKPGYAMCEQIRAISKERLKNRWGRISPNKMAEVEAAIKVLLGMRS